MQTEPRPRVAAGDAALLARAREGDPQAFAALVGRFDRPLRALAFRLLGDRQRMDDALQEAYVKAYRALPSFSGNAAFSTWLYRIVYNACLDELRRTRRLVELPLDGGSAGAAPSAGPEEAVARRVDLAAALGALPVELRAVVLLVDAEGMSYDEAGEVLGVPVGTVASRLSRARTALREALAEHAKGVDAR